MSWYSEQLQHPKWQKKRLEILSRDGFECVNCGSGEEEGRTLDVHHKRYKGKPWEAESEDLETLCRACHDALTEMEKRLKRVIERLPPENLVDVIGYAVAILAKRGIDATGELTWSCRWGLAEGLRVPLSRLQPMLKNATTNGRHPTDDELRRLHQTHGRSAWFDEAEPEQGEAEEETV